MTCALQMKLGLTMSQKHALHAAGKQYKERVQALFSERDVLRGMLEVSGNQHGSRCMPECANDRPQCGSMFRSHC